MKLNPDTLAILKNFSGINQSLLFKKGSTLTTVNQGKSTLAIAKVRESFPGQFAVFDLNELLSAWSMFKNPDLEIKDNCLVIHEEKSKSTLFYTDETMIVTPPSDTTKMQTVVSSSEVKFLLSEENLSALQKGAAIFGSPEYTISSDGETITITAVDTNNPTSNRFSLDLGEGNGDTFDMVLKTSSLTLLKGPYEVSLSSKGISHFKNTEIDLEYFISLDESSSYHKA